MSKTVHVVEFSPEVGKTVGLPEEPRRQRVVRGPQAAGGRKPLAVVVGTGGLEEYVLRSTTDESTELHPSDVILGVEPPANTHRETRLWFATPVSRYGGGS